MVPAEPVCMRRVLVVAAEAFELAPIREAVKGRSSCEFVFTANGPGPKLAAEAVRAAGGVCKFDAVVSVGICGALVDGLEVGSIVVGRSINGIDVMQPRSSDSFMAGDIASVDFVAVTAAEKRRLRDTGAIAVEMEAAGVREQVAMTSKPFYCIKAVSDLSDESFLIDLNAARGEDGRFRVTNILGQALRRPLTGVPELLRLKRNSERAVRSLGEFFGSCSF